MEGERLREVEEVKDLGITNHQSLKPSHQCLAAAKKANRLLGMIYRNISYKSPKSQVVMKRLYKQLVRPHLEHACQAWSSWLRKDIELLESVQRRATRMIDGFRELSYQERLRRLHLTTLERRRARGDVIETFKILKGIDDVDYNHFFNIDENLHNTRGHQLKLRRAHTRLNVRKNYFSCRAVSLFNAVPPSAAVAQMVLSLMKAIVPVYGRERATDQL